ncbi:MAG: protein-export chaperone SecB [Rhodospirillales bacterium]|nr:protein-export chaperone SecB [Rhodospirillales bacterium]MDE0379725.1 protein-export chaperone SecB [Rhodospirillales bacterium]
MTADETGTETPPTPAPSGNGGNGQTPAAEGAAQEAQDTRPQLGIRTQYIKDLSFENPSATNRPPEAERAPDIAVNVQVSVRRLDETTFEVTLQITANARHQEKPVFLVELTYAGIFTLVGIPQEALEPTLLVECPRLLFPFARRIVADVTRDGGFPPLLLGPIDFLALYRNGQAQAQAQAAQAPATQGQPPSGGAA